MSLSYKVRTVGRVEEYVAMNFSLFGLCLELGSFGCTAVVIAKPFIQTRIRRCDFVNMWNLHPAMTYVISLVALLITGCLYFSFYEVLKLCYLWLLKVFLNNAL